MFSVFPSLASLPPRLPRRWFAAPRGILEASRSYITLSGPPLSVNHRLFTSFGPHTSTRLPPSPLPPLPLSPITPSLNPPHVLPYLRLLLFFVTSTYSFYPSLLPFPSLRLSTSLLSHPIYPDLLLIFLTFLTSSSTCIPRKLFIYFLPLFFTYYYSFVVPSLFPSLLSFLPHTLYLPHLLIFLHTSFSSS